MYAKPERVDLARYSAPVRSGLPETMIDGLVRAEAVWFSVNATDPAATATTAAAVIMRSFAVTFLRFLGDGFLYFPCKAQLPYPRVTCAVDQSVCCGQW
jgi:hypothetical protein